MKKLLSIILVTVTVFTLFSCTAESLPASDYVRGTKPMIDNETPYIYTEGCNSPAIAGVEKFYNEEMKYKDFAKIYGNKPVRHYTNGGEDHYYTVYSDANRHLIYLFLQKDENGDLVLKKDSDFGFMYANTLECYFSPNNKSYSELLLEHDYPERILEGKLPYNNDPLYISGSSSLMSSMNKWYDFERMNNLLSLDQGVNRVDGEVITYYRIIFSNSFDYTDKYGRIKQNAYYVYEITIYNDGTGELHFTHLDASAPYHNLLANQDETAKLTKEDLAPFLNAVEIYHFYEIPTAHPEEKIGLDGNTTYILGIDGEKIHLTSMWCASDRHSIYHIRTTVEELTRVKINPQYGSIYVDYDN